MATWWIGLQQLVTNRSIGF